MFNRAIGRPSATDLVPNGNPPCWNSCDKYHPSENVGAAANIAAKAILISIGVWGPRQSDVREFVAANRHLEQKVHELGGAKWLYAHCHYAEEEIWNVYDRQWYDNVRAKHNATYLPSV